MKMALVYQKLVLEGLFQVHMRLYTLCHGTAFQWDCSYFRFVEDETEGLNSFPLGAQLIREGRSLDVKLLYLFITSFPQVTNSRLWYVCGLKPSSLLCSSFFIVSFAWGQLAGVLIKGPSSFHLSLPVQLCFQNFSTFHFIFLAVYCRYSSSPGIPNLH